MTVLNGSAGITSSSSSDFSREETWALICVSEPTDGKLKLFALLMLHLNSHVAAT